MSILQKNKKLAAGIGVAAVAAAALALGAGTYAAFTDTETGPGGTLAAGTLDLVIGDPTGTAVFSATNIAPGYVSETRTLRYLNNGTIPGTLSLGFSAANQENGCNEAEAEFDQSCSGTDGELGAALIVAIEGPGLSYTGPIAGIPAVNGAVVPAAERTGASYKVIFSLPRETTNVVQSDSVLITSTATLTQR